MQKTSFFKRIMTLFLAFIMVLGILPLSSMVVPAQALMDVSGGTGDPPATITNNSHKFLGNYNSPVLDPPRVTPRIFDFNVGDGVAPGFCGDHSKDINWGATWSSPQSLTGTKYEVIMPLLAAYCQKWFYSRMLDEKHPDWSVTQKKNQAKEDLGSQFYYYTEEERITGSAMVQAAAWLAGADMLSNLSDHDQQMLIAHERNLTMKAANGFVNETDEEVARWVANSVAAYAEGEYGQWEAYIYYPGGNLQPIITVLPPGPIDEFEGWIKIKKTDLSGNNLAGATFGIYVDSGCQEGTERATFVTTADEWTYFNVSEYMDSATQTFYLKEISAPDDYVANSKGYSVTVSSTNNSTQETAAAVNGGVAIKNGLPQPPEGVVNKVDQDGNGIGPATFHFKSLTNSVDADFETDENGELQFQWTDPNGENYIQPGEYTVTEEIAPPGYEPSDEAQNLRLWIEDIDGVPRVSRSQCSSPRGRGA